MKISSASKKVLASALSAAMVVAFAPTVAFAGDTVVAKNSYISSANGQTVTVEYYDADAAFTAAMAPSLIKNAAGTAQGLYAEDKAGMALVDDMTVTKSIVDSSGADATTLTVDLGGKTLTSKGADDLAHAAFTVVGEGTVAAAGTYKSTFNEVNVGTDKATGSVTFDGGIYEDIDVEDGSSIAIKSGIFKTDSAGKGSVLYYAIQDAINNGATVTYGDDADSATANNYTAGDGLTASKYYKVASTVAKVNGESFSSLKAAYDSITSAGQTIVLEADIAYNANDSIVTSGGHVVAVDLNGHTIERANLVGSDAAIDIVGTGKLLGVTTNKNITIGSSGSANVTVADSAAKKTEKVPTPSTFNGNITVKAGSTLTVENTEKDSAAALDVYGTVNIAKGDFASLTVQNNAYATVAKGDFDNVGTGTSAVTVVNGGTLVATQMTYAVNSSGVASNKLDKKFIASGSVINAKSDTAFEVGAPVATATKVSAAADNKTTYETAVQCASLTGAVYNASAKTTVTLDADVEESVIMNTAAKEKVVVDLNGKTVKGGIEVTGTGDKLTIKNGTVAGNGCEAVKVNAAATLVVLESGTFTTDIKTAANGDKTRPTALITGASKLTIAGGTFKDATYKVNGATIQGGTFDKKPTVTGVYTVVENADGTYTVVVGKSATVNFNATGGMIKLVTKDSAGNPTATENPGDVFTVADVDKALEKAVEAAYAKAVTAAWAANPAAKELAGFEFYVDSTGKSKTVKDLTDAAQTPAGVNFALDIYKVDSSKSKLTADKDYAVDQAYDVKISVATAAGTIGYLTGIAADVTYVYAQDTANYTYKFLGDEKASYDATKKAYTFSTTTGAQFGVEKISNSILELQEQMKQMEIVAQDKAAANTIKGTAKTIKTKKGVTAKKYTVKVKAVTSESGAKATYKKANTAGKSKITVAKSGTITIKKGLKKGTYKVKVKGTVGASSKTVTAKIVIK